MVQEDREPRGGRAPESASRIALRTGVSGRGVGVDRPEHSDLDGPTSVQIDAQLFVMLSALADGKASTS